MKELTEGHSRMTLAVILVLLLSPTAWNEPAFKRAMSSSSPSAILTCSTW